MIIENTDTKLIYTISLTEIELKELYKELFKVDFSLNPTLRELYHKLIRA